MFSEAIQKKMTEAMEQHMMNSIFGNLNPSMGSGSR
jgi:hypothetical protein